MWENGTQSLPRAMSSSGRSRERRMSDIRGTMMMHLRPPNTQTLPGTWPSLRCILGGGYGSIVHQLRRVCKTLRSISGTKTDQPVSQSVNQGPTEIA